jgi:hypothetical protein
MVMVVMSFRAHRITTYNDTASTDEDDPPQISKVRFFGSSSLITASVGGHHNRRFGTRRIKLPLVVFHKDNFIITFN